EKVVWGGGGRRDSRRRGGRREAEIQSVRQRVARRDRGDLQARKIARASFGPRGIPFGRMHALFEPDRAGRERARWPLARQSQDGMRYPYDENFLSSRISEDIEAAELQTMKCGFVD